MLEVAAPVEVEVVPLPEGDGVFDRGADRSHWLALSVLSCAAPHRGDVRVQARAALGLGVESPAAQGRRRQPRAGRNPRAESAAFTPGLSQTWAGAPPSLAQIEAEM